MKILTFGEVMLRLATPHYQRLNQAQSLEMTFGGGEANVAVFLALMGEEAVFVTRLPKNDVAEACIQQLRGFGVTTREILRGGERMGIYFLETGASQRPSTVIYDRAHSAISEIVPSDLDWENLFRDTDWFHFTGITPALSDNAAQAVLEGARAAKKLGLTVSCDLNYRKKLWTAQRAGEVMRSFTPYVDICIANEEDAEMVFGIKAAGSAVTEGRIDHSRYIEVASKLTETFKFKAVAITLRESISASRNGWSALYYTAGKAYLSRRYDVQIVDRVGGGDSFAAGLIYALGKRSQPQEAIEFAAAASCLKHTIKGDFNLVKLSEIETLLAGDESGRVQR